MRPFAYVTAALLLTSAAALAQVPAPNRWGAETATLPNGMEVIVLPQRRVPAVHHLVLYKVGSADEEPGKSGLAHYLEHLMFKGTEKTPPGAFDALVNRFGGRQNAFTTYDYTGYFQTMPRDQLAAVMALEADRMAGLKLSDANSKPELTVVLEERNQRTNRPPGGQLSELANATLFINHPYRRPIIGWEAEIKGLTYQDALEFHARWYAPNNAVLVVAGDTDLAEVQKLAENTYGKVSAQPLPPRPVIAEPARVAPALLVERSPRVTDAAWGRRALIPSWGTATPKEVAALALLTDILGGGIDSRLDRALVRDGKLALAAGAGADLLRRGPGMLYLSATPAPGVPLQTVEATVESVLETLRRDGVTPEEMARSLQRLTGGEAYDRDSLTGLANRIGRGRMVGQSLADMAGEDDLLRSLTVADVNRAAQVLLPTAFVTTHLLPKPAL